MTELYSTEILRYGQRVRYLGLPSSATEVVVKQNTLCGDRIVFGLRQGGEKLEAVGFELQGCMLSSASASLMAELVEGNSVIRARDVLEAFTDLVSGARPVRDLPAQMAAFAHVLRWPGRKGCVLLPWNALAETVAVSTVHQHHG